MARDDLGGDRGRLLGERRRGGKERGGRRRRRRSLVEKRGRWNRERGE